MKETLYLNTQASNLVNNKQSGISCVGDIAPTRRIFFLLALCTIALPDAISNIESIAIKSLGLRHNGASDAVSARSFRIKLR